MSPFGRAGVPATVTRTVVHPGVPAVVTRTAWRLVLVGAAAASAVVAAVPDPARPVAVAALLSVAAAVLAAVTGWRLAGTGALILVTLTVLLASALDPSDLRPVQLVTAGLLVLVVITALDRVEQAGRKGVTVAGAPTARRLAAPALALGAACLVSLTAAQHVVPSVGLVLVGIAAAVAALLVATRAHRDGAGPDVPK